MRVSLVSSQPREMWIIVFQTFPICLPWCYYTCSILYPIVVTLGLPIGDESFCDSFLSSAIMGTNNQLHQHLQKLEDPWTALALLRQCTAFSASSHTFHTHLPRWFNLLLQPLTSVSVSSWLCVTPLPWACIWFHLCETNFPLNGRGIQVCEPGSICAPCPTKPLRPTMS